MKSFCRSTDDPFLEVIQHNLIKSIFRWVFIWFFNTIFYVLKVSWHEMQILCFSCYFQIRWYRVKSFFFLPNHDGQHLRSVLWLFSFRKFTNHFWKVEIQPCSANAIMWCDIFHLFVRQNKKRKPVMEANFLLNKYWRPYCWSSLLILIL